MTPAQREPPQFLFPDDCTGRKKHRVRRVKIIPSRLGKGKEGERDQKEPPEESIGPAGRRAQIEVETGQPERRGDKRGADIKLLNEKPVRPPVRDIARVNVFQEFKRD